MLFVRPPLAAAAGRRRWPLAIERLAELMS
jgi:hypothetical protein